MKLQKYRGWTAASAFVVGTTLTAFLVASAHDEGRSAVALLAPTSGNKTAGTIKFQETDDGVSLKGEITNLAPGEHGFHVHQFGDCTSDDAESAGPHYNPTHQSHDGREGAHRHVGDLGNVTADKDGVAKIDFTDKLLSLKGENSIIGRSIIVHEHRDDLKSEPTGHSGGRLACGVIGFAK